MRSSVKAFTVLEMLINMVIMSIIVTMVYYLYTSFSQQVYSYQNATDEGRVLQSWYGQLKKDCYLANKIIETPDGVLEFHFYDNHMVHYKYENQRLLRLQATDTLDMKALKLDTETFEHVLTNEQLVYKIAVATELFGETIDIAVAKKYAPNLTMQF